ncbi:YesL family protein [Salipaludibacillus sp. CF4.18]|uniref:YesL family protein n=1 Tax=Salipaludibacillus sp. CF4.18 TaxID=3373081 RepID=UPI003EE582F8
MDNKGLIGGFYKLTEWIMRLAYLNILWVVFTLVGLVVLGLGPATAATFAVTRKWITEDVEIAIFPTFWRSYRTEFLRANFFTLGMAFVGWILYIDYSFIITFEGTTFYFLMGVFYIAVCIFILMSFFLFPVLVHFDLKTFTYLKYMMLISISFPHMVFAMLAGTIIIFYLTLKFPALLFFFAISTTSLCIMWFAMVTF